MNIVSPFGRLSRKGYLAVAVPLFVVQIGLAWATWHFVPAPAGPIAELAETPWFRWLMIAAPVGYLVEWGLFCAAVKRLHDFRWTGIVALPLLATMAQAVIIIALPVVAAHGRPGLDLPQWLGGVSRIGVGLRFFGWALLIALAIIPGVRTGTPAPAAEAAF